MPDSRLACLLLAAGGLLACNMPSPPPPPESSVTCAQVESTAIAAGASATHAKALGDMCAKNGWSGPARDCFGHALGKRDVERCESEHLSLTGKMELASASLATELAAVKDKGKSKQVTTSLQAVAALRRLQALREAAAGCKPTGGDPSTLELITVELELAEASAKTKVQEIDVSSPEAEADSAARAGGYIEEREAKSRADLEALGCPLPGGDAATGSATGAGSAATPGTATGGKGSGKGKGKPGSSIPRSGP